MGDKKCKSVVELLDSIPIDIYREIFYYVEKSTDFFNLRLVCKVLHRVMNKFIVQTVPLKNLNYYCDMVKNGITFISEKMIIGIKTFENDKPLRYFRDIGKLDNVKELKLDFRKIHNAFNPISYALGLKNITCLSIPIINLDIIKKLPENVEKLQIYKQNFTIWSKIFSKISDILSLPKKLLFSFSSRFHHDTIICQNKINTIFLTPLMIEIKNNNLNNVKQILENNEEEHTRKIINSIYENGATPIHIAIETNNINMIELLIQYGADLQQMKNTNIDPPIVFVCGIIEYGYNDLIKYILKKGVDINQKSKYKNGDTPLIKCIKNRLCDVGLIEYLINNGADINQCDNLGFSPLYYVFMYGTMVDIEFFINHGVTIENITKENTKPYLLFCSMNKFNKSKFELLLELGMDPNIPYHPLTGEDLYILNESIKQNEIKNLEILLKYNADIHVKDKCRCRIKYCFTNYNNEHFHEFIYSSLYFAVYNNNYKMTKKLLEIGADPNEPFLEKCIIGDKIVTFKNYVLILSIEYKNDQITELLLNFGANINIGYGMDKLTPLMVLYNNYDTIFNYENSIMGLIKKNLDINKQDINGFTVVSRVCQLELPFVLEHLLEEYRPNLHIGDKKNNNTPLHICALKQNFICIGSLLTNNANPNIVNKNGESPFFISCKLGDFPSVERYLQYHHHQINFDICCRYEIENTNKCLTHGDTINLITVTPIYIAIFLGFDDIVALLIDKSNISLNIKLSKKNQHPFIGKILKNFKKKYHK